MLVSENYPYISNHLCYIGLTQTERGCTQELHLAVPPTVPAVLGGPEFRPADWKTLSKYLDGLSVMTYDYARAGPAPNAPLPWIDGNVDALTYNQDLRYSPMQHSLG